MATFVSDEVVWTHTIFVLNRPLSTTQGRKSTVVTDRKRVATLVCCVVVI